VPSFLVESYQANSPTALTEARARARLAAELDETVQHLRTTFVPGDEVVLHMFEAPSGDAVRRAAHRAALECERIVEAVEGSL
jgi:hypothetical protein